jgi:hypothetical protein
MSNGRHGGGKSLSGAAKPDDKKSVLSEAISVRFTGGARYAAAILRR